MFGFEYDPEILERFPTLCGGVILAQGISNGKTPKALREAFLAEQEATKARIGDTPLSELEPLAAWRKAFRAFGVNPTKYRSAPEALLRRLTKKGDVPSINTLVDAGNLVSIRYALPIAFFDPRAVEGPVRVHLAKGDERFTPLFKEQVEHPEAGEVIFSDETGLVVARRWCWRQSDDSASREDTTEAIITLEAQHEGGRATVEKAMEDLLELLKAYAGGSFKSAILGPAQPSISL